MQGTKSYFARLIFTRNYFCSFSDGEADRPSLSEQDAAEAKETANVVH